MWCEEMDIAATLIASLLSGVVGVTISTLYYRRHEKRKQKFEVLRRIVGTRYALTEKTTNEAKVVFFSALNEVVVLFHDDREVIGALNNLHRELKVQGRLHDNLVTLFKAMCRNLNVSSAGLNDEFFLRPFSPSVEF